MAIENEPSVAAAPDSTRVPTLAQALSELRLHGAGGMAQWQALLGPLAAQVRARDEALTARRKSAENQQAGVILSSLLAGFLVGWMAGAFFGIVVAVVGSMLAFALIKPPAADFAGTERIGFVSEIVAALAAIAPNGSVRLAAQLHAARGIPELSSPGNSGEERGEREDAWLRGSLQGIPGLRLSWQATEWRTIRRRRTKNSRGKIKIKTKLAYASRLVARLDADHALFALDAGQAPQHGPEGAIDARKTARGYTVRGWRERSAKIPLGAKDVREEIALWRNNGARECFGEPASELVSLMRLCEERLTLRGTKGGA